MNVHAGKFTDTCINNIVYEIANKIKSCAKTNGMDGNTKQYITK